MRKIELYCAYNYDEKIRLESSSGGIFYLLAKYIIEKKHGVVFGAKFGERFEIIHDYTESLDGISEFMGSKYSQSDMRDCYAVALKFLKKGRVVLFSGTPCQCAGLNALCNENRNNLYLVDFICHGVPSPKVWEEYLITISKGLKVNSVEFREKKQKNNKYSWNKYLVKIKYGNFFKYNRNHNRDLYFTTGINSNLFLRPSCYKCKFRGFNRCVDITMGDFWNVSKIYPQMDDDHGTSIIMVHSYMGKELFNSIKGSLKYISVSKEDVLKSVSYVEISPKKPEERSEFFKDDDISYIIKMKKYMHLPILFRVKRKIKYIFGWKH